MNRKLAALRAQNREEADRLEEQLAEIRPRMVTMKPMAVSFKSPESSTIAQGLYSRAEEELTLTFTTGKTYRYRGVPMALWVGFLEAESKGHYFSAKIRPFFTGELAA
jgi:hypothetical protein